MSIHRSAWSEFYELRMQGHRYPFPHRSRPFPGNRSPDLRLDSLSYPGSGSIG